jgi:hypothetical protein
MAGCCSKMTRSPTDQMDIAEAAVFDMHCQAGRFHDDALSTMLFRRLREVLNGNLDYECDLSGSAGQIQEPSEEERAHYRALLRGEARLPALRQVELLHVLDGGTVESWVGAL